MTLFHLVVEIVALVILLECHDNQLFLAWVAKHGGVVEFYLDPFLAGIHLAFLLGILLQVLVARAELCRIVFQVAVDVATLPVATPFLYFFVVLFVFLV